MTPGIWGERAELAAAKPHALETLGVLELLEPVHAHRLEHATVDDDDASFGVRIGIEVLVGTVGWDVDEVTLRPFETLRRGLPFEFHRIMAIEFHVPVEIVA